MKIAEFDITEIPMELIFMIEEFVRNNSKLKFGTGVDFQSNIREWFLEVDD